MSFNYHDANGQQQSVVVTYTPLTVETYFQCTGINEYGPTLTNLPTSISYPDGSHVDIKYELTPNGSGHYTGRIAQVTLGTGGVISYIYKDGNNGVECSDGSTAGFTRTTPDGTSQYDRTGSGTQWTTTVADATPQQNQTVISFQTAGPAPVNYYETKRQIYAGAATPQTLLRTIDSCYNGSPRDCTATARALPITEQSVYTTLENGKVSQVNMFFDSTFGRPTEVDEYDFGAGSPTRKTITTYAIDSSSPCPNHNVPPDRVCTIQTLDANGQQAAYTSYGYDESTATPTSGVPHHVAPPSGRGNLTSINEWRNLPNATTLTTILSYDDTGNVLTEVYPNSSTFTFQYSQCGSAFLTNTMQQQLNLTSSATWDCNGGVMTTSIDENNQKISQSYNDPLWRLTSITDSLLNTTSTVYTPATIGSTPASIERTLNFNSGTSTSDLLTTMDPLGRPILSQVRQSPGASSFDSIQTAYDSVARPYKVTQPYAGISGQGNSGPSASTSYDPLNRITQQTDAAGGFTSYSYSGRDVLVTIGPAAPGENAKRRQLEFDALGRLISVCEITSSIGSGVCGQDSSQTGYWTKYIYDALDHLIGVTQNAQGVSQSRSYTYDSLGRMTSENTPESGTINYIYDSVSLGNCQPNNSPGDLVMKTDAAGNGSCYVYDALHRVKSIGQSYSNSPNASVTPDKCFVYDSAVVNGLTMANTKGRLAEAYTVTQGTGCGAAKITDEGFSYSARGELTDIYESSPRSGGYYHVSQSYWPNGAVNTISGLGLPTLTYAVDGEGRNSTVSASSGQNPVTLTSYNTAGSPTAVSFGSGDSDSFAYDPNTNRITQYDFTVGSSPQSLVGSLTWSSNGNLSALNISDPFNNADTQNCVDSYDDLGRVNTVNCGTIGGTWSSTGANIYHLCGRADGDGWSVNVVQDPANCWLQYGPYTSQISTTGNFLAQWSLLIDNNSADNLPVVHLDVNDATGGGVIASMDVTRQQFNSPGVYQTFSLPFSINNSQVGHQLEFRVSWYGYAYIREKAIDYSTTSSWSQSFSYDMFGNISKSGSGAFQPTYSSATNRIASLPGFTPSYDANGNLTNDGAHSYAWDAAGNLIGIDSITRTFDALGRLVEINRGGSYQQVVYSPSGGKLAIMAGQSMVRAYVPLPAGATAVYGSGGVLSYYRHPDWLGSSRFASTPSRTMYYDGAYAPFGESYAEAGTTDRSFTGQNQDTVPGLNDFLYREHSPTQGRWLSPDPYMGSMDLNNPQSLNRYVYVLNSPLTHVDPSGLKCIPSSKTGDDNPCSLFGQASGGLWSWLASGVAPSPGSPSFTVDGLDTPSGLALGLLSSGAAAQCPNNDCSGLRLQGNSFFGLVYSAQAVLNCIGSSLNDYGCAWSHWSMPLVADVDDMYLVGDARWKYVLGQSYRLSAGPVYGSAVGTAIVAGGGLVGMVTLEGGSAGSILGPRLIYGDNALQTDLFHSVPNLIGSQVVGEGSITLGSQTYVQFSMPGALNGVQGIFQVGGYLTGPTTLYVVHNFFHP